MEDFFGGGTNFKQRLFKTTRTSVETVLQFTAMCVQKLLQNLNENLWLFSSYSGSVTKRSPAYLFYGLALRDFTQQDENNHCPRLWDCCSGVGKGGRCVYDWGLVG